MTQFSKCKDIPIFFLVSAPGVKIIAEAKYILKYQFSLT